MAPSPLSSDDVSTLIDHLLKEKDPAAVGLRRILKRKQQQGASYPCRPVSFEELSAEDKERKVLNDDERRVLELEKRVGELEGQLKEAKSNAERAVQAAYRKGREEGRVEGEKTGQARAGEQAQKQIAALQEKTAAFMHSVEEGTKRVYANVEHQVANLALRLARKILNTEPTVNQEVVFGVIRKALTYIADQERLVVRVAPGDYEAVSGKKDFWVPVTEGLGEVSIEQDERVEPGGCIVESNAGVVDARLGTQYNDLADLIEKTWNRTAGAGAAQSGAQSTTELSTASPVEDQPGTPHAPDTQSTGGE